MGIPINFYKIKQAVLALFGIIVMLSCDDLSFHSGIKHGKIEYNITYPEIPENSYKLDLMPKKMETTFKNGNYRNDIIAGMGLFKTSIIRNADEKDLIHSVKMLNKKYASQLSHEDIVMMNPNFQNVEVKLLPEKKEIAGYQCKSADIKVLGDTTWTFKLYYTDEINIKDANLYTPFKDIKGVLMEYEINSYDTHMKFEAVKVLNQEVTDEEIKLEDDYEMVTPEFLRKEIEGIFTTIQ